MVQIQRNFKTVLLVVITIFAWQCAAVQAPPGGAVDKTPPKLISADPPAMTVNFNQRTTWLTFTEYLDENSTRNAINIYPALKEEVKVQYKGKRLRLTWPENLPNNRTYILNITKNLKDEHGVPLSEPIQIAYSTGDDIDNGSISGKVFGGKNTTLLLWQTFPDSSSDSLVFKNPDFEVQASADGNYVFGFLPEGNFKMAAFDGAKPGQGVPLDQLKFGLPFISDLIIEDSTSIIDLNVQLLEGKKTLKILRLIPGSDNWGQLSFNKTLLPVEADSIIFLRDSVQDERIRSFIYGADSTVLVFQANDKLLTEIDSLRVRSERDDIDAVFFTAGKFKKDTLKPILLPFNKNYIYNVHPDTSLPVNLYADRPLADSLWSKMSITLFKDDSLFIPANMSLENSMWIKVVPEENLEAESSYNLSVVYDTTSSDIDTVLFPFKTSIMAGLGNLEGQVDAWDKENLVVQIENVENSKITYRNYVNSTSYYSIENVYEGKYTLMLFEDLDRNFKYSSGTLLPFNPGEWFYMYPDTIDIRGNWTIQADIK